MHRKVTDTKFAIGGFVLAGGESRRMGRDKALLEFQREPLALRAARLLQPYAEEVTLLGPAQLYSHLDLPVIPDAFPSRGPLAALCTALKYSKYHWNAFLAC